jgi:S-phase kinase-associated protein 1
MTAAAGKEKMLTLISSDLEKFEVEESAARESRTIGNMIEDSCADNDIPLPNVNARILAKVIVYCRKHAAARGGADGGDAGPTAATNKASEDELKTFDAEFVKVDQATLFDLILVRPSHPIFVWICLCELLKVAASISLLRLEICCSEIGCLEI